MKVTRPRGTRDFLPEDTARRKYVENIMRNIACNWGYSEIITPTFEHLDLFTLKSGEGIERELYNFMDKGGRAMTLRPELTASVMRLYVNELQSFPKPLNLFYFTNCFRYERPQKVVSGSSGSSELNLLGAETPILMLRLSLLQTPYLKQLV